MYSMYTVGTAVLVSMGLSKMIEKEVPHFFNAIFHLEEVIFQFTNPGRSDISIHQHVVILKVYRRRFFWTPLKIDMLPW